MNNQIDGVSLPVVTLSKQGSLVKSLLRLIRPHHWVKNVFVFAPLLFNESVRSLATFGQSGIAFASFCLWASAVYIVNDIVDAPSDRKHPRKRTRPIAARLVPLHLAYGLAVVLIGLGTAISALYLPPVFLLVGGAYLVNSLVYCLLFRHRVIIDVVAIAVGFVIRVMGGSMAIGIEPSCWIIVCTFGLAMLLGFGKRRAEVEHLDQSENYRSTLISYSAVKLNTLLSITASICILSYMLYTVSPDTIKLHQTGNLIYTVPFVAYGVFRYILKAQEGAGDGPVEILLKDHVFFWNGLLWVLTVFGILYWF